jgi:hypothetical protein
MINRRLLQVLTIPLALAGSGCATTTTKEVHPLIKRASFDLDCPREKLTWRKFDDLTYGVKGCGQKATYIESCRGNGVNETCVWVRNL